MAPLTRKRKAADDAAQIQQKKPASKGKAVDHFCYNDVTHTKRVDRENVTPAKANPPTLEKDKDTQNTNQIRRDNLFRNENSFIDVNVDKCNMCSRLEVQAKSDKELNRVCQATVDFIDQTAN